MKTLKVKFLVQYKIGYDPEKMTEVESIKTVKESVAWHMIEGFSTAGVIWSPFGKVSKYKDPK